MNAFLPRPLALARRVRRVGEDGAGEKMLDRMLAMLLDRVRIGDCSGCHRGLKGCMGRYTYTLECVGQPKPTKAHHSRARPTWARAAICMAVCQ